MSSRTVTRSLQASLVKVDTATVYAARVLATLTILQFNDIIVTATGVAQASSPIMLISAVILIAKTGFRYITKPLILFIIVILVYLIIGTFVYSENNGVELGLVGRTYISFVSTIIIVVSIAFYISAIGESKELLDYLKFVRNCFVLGAGSIWLSSFINSYRVVVDVDAMSAGRAGGLYSNPNDAGVVANTAMALVLAYPYGKRVFQLGAISNIFGAVVLTLSKSAMTACVLLLAWQYVRSVKSAAGATYAAIAVVLILLIVQSPNIIFDWIVEQRVVELTSAQQERILAVGKLMQGEIDSSTTTGRTDVWRIGVERAIEMFPFSSGLGSYHFLVGGMYSGNVWLGVHNTFLMLLGEGGVLSLALFIWLYFLLVWCSFRYSAGSFVWSYLFIELVELNASHNALENRYANFSWGILLGLLAVYERRWRLKAHKPLGPRLR